MCGRYTLYQTGRLVGRFKLSKKQLKDLKERYNIAPSQTEPVVIEKNDERHLELMRWGFMPPWSKDPKSVFKYSTFNARSEGIFEKPLWKSAIKSSRCLVPANGFYEWKKEEKEKQPFFIRPKGQELFAFAGVYNHWKDVEGKEWGTYSILTTEANKDMESIHNRMPVILKPEDEDLWLESSNDEPDAIAELMRPYEDGMLDIVEVSRDVNNSRSEGAGLITPLNSQ